MTPFRPTILVLGLLSVGFYGSAFSHSDEATQNTEAETKHDHQSQKHAEHQSEESGQPGAKTHNHGASHTKHSHWNAPADAAARLNPVSADDASISRGEAIFHFRCVGCHGAGGQGDGPIATALEPKPADLVTMVPHHTDGDLAWKIANGRGFMPGWNGVLSEDQIWDVVNYLRALGRQKCC